MYQIHSPPNFIMNIESSQVKLSKVEFVGVGDQYSNDENLTCEFRLLDHVAEEGDRVAIYKSGWMFVKDYCVFEWVDVGGQNIVTFTNHCLPRDKNEYFQFCYISADNAILGVSGTFQFTQNIPIHKSVSSTDLNTNSMSQTSSEDRDYMENEIRKLRQENRVLKRTLQLLTQDGSPDYDHEISKLKTTVMRLKEMVDVQKNEIGLLKTQVKLCLESNRSLAQDKIVAEKKYEQLQDVVVKSGTYDLGELEDIPPFPFAR